MKYLKEIFKDNLRGVIVASIMIMSATILTFILWFERTFPNELSPHDSEEVCHELGGELIQYTSVLAGSVAVPIYKCMKPLTGDEQKREEIE